MSEFNQRAYELFVQPLVQAMSNEYTAKLTRAVPSAARAALGDLDLNPWLAWLEPAARGGEGATASRSTTDNPLRKRREAAALELISASLDYYRALRDALTEAGFFTIYGNMFSLYLADKQAAAAARCRSGRSTRASCRSSQDALASIDEGGYVEALARVGVPAGAQRTSRCRCRGWQMRHEIAADYAELPARHAAARVAAHPRRAGNHRALRARARRVATLPALLRERADRAAPRSTLLDKLLADRRVQRAKPTPEQLAMIDAHPQRAVREAQRARRPKPGAPRMKCARARSQRPDAQEDRIATARTTPWNASTRSTSG